MKFEWTKIEQDAFNEIKRIVARDTLLAYLDFNEEFKIHTNARKIQSGAVVTRKRKPIVFYSRQLTDAQKRYKLTEKEMSSTVETQKEFRTILLVQILIIDTDHKNLHVNVLY